MAAMNKADALGSLGKPGEPSANAAPAFPTLAANALLAQAAANVTAPDFSQVNQPREFTFNGLKHGSVWSCTRHATRAPPPREAAGVPY